MGVTSGAEKAETRSDQRTEAMPEMRASPRFKSGFALLQLGVGLASTCTCTYILATGPWGDAELQRLYQEQVDPDAYKWPMIAFWTAMFMNFMLLLFERESAKFQLALLACYINLLAGFADYLSWREYMPVMRDRWGCGMQISRWTMYLHTTPSMVYLLSMISDFSRMKVYRVMCADGLMLVLGIAAQLTANPLLALTLYTCAFSCFGFVVDSMWHMFDAPLKEARDNGSRFSLLALRLTTVGLWFSFPVIYTVAKLGLLSINQEEWLWTVFDFLGKCMFSTSLLQGNFLTIEQRRLIAMRIVEESNRLQVIQELKGLVEQKERFMSSMSHELRTPLNGIIGLSDALLVGSCGVINDMAQKTISTIKTSGSRLLNLINDILDAASMRQGKLVVRHEKVKLPNVVDDVLELCQPLAKRNVRLINDVSASFPFVKGDSGRIIQILHNLVGNSCKFTHSGSICVSAVHKGDEVEVSVSDSGIGIPDDKFESIFQAFEQVDMSTTRKYGGTGLGLNLVKQLVEAHDGRISVRSKLGAGTTFFFTLKVWDEKEDGTAPPSPTHTNARRSLSRSSVTSSSNPASAAGGSVPDRNPRAGAGTTTSAAARGSSTTGAQEGHSPSKAAPASTTPSAAAAGASKAPVSTAAATAGGASMSGAAMALKAAANPVNKPATSLAGTGAAGNDSPKGASAVTTADSAKGYRAVGVSGPVTLKDAVTLTSTLKKRPSRILGNKIRVLSVDDDPVNQMVIQNLLTPEGYEITQAMDGQEALDLMASAMEPPDVILLDVMMPGMSGYEVCRKLRELYPLSCIPIIMVSAKSKEEHIVEGLAAGSNDYVVKPFGRQEILARITAHLRFRDTVCQAFEMADMLEGKAPLDDVPAGLQKYMATVGLTSLPPTVATQVKAGKGGALQTFRQLTALCIRVSNLDQLAGSLPAAELAAALAGLHARLDQLQEQWGAYLAYDALQGHLTLVTGLKGEAVQADNALSLARALLEQPGAAKEGDGDGHQQPPALTLTMAIHTLPAQGVIIGSDHPVLHLAGELPEMGALLLDCAPPGCALVSAKAFAAAQGSKSSLASTQAQVHGEPTYLLKAGAHWEQGLKAAEGLSAKYSTRPEQGSCAVLRTDAPRLAPLQRALMDLVRYSPATALKLGAAPQAADPAAQEAPATNTGNSGATDAKQVPELQAALDKALHEKKIISRQLDEVSEEAGRLQDQVDELEKELQAAREELGEAQTKLKHHQELQHMQARRRSTVVELPDPFNQAHALEAQVACAKVEAANAAERLASAEKRLASTQAALRSSLEQQAFEASAAADPDTTTSVTGTTAATHAFSTSSSPLLMTTNSAGLNAVTGPGTPHVMDAPPSPTAGRMAPSRSRLSAMGQSIPYTQPHMPGGLGAAVLGAGSPGRAPGGLLGGLASSSVLTSPAESVDIGGHHGFLMTPHSLPQLRGVGGATGSPAHMAHGFLDGPSSSSSVPAAVAAAAPVRRPPTARHSSIALGYAGAGHMSSMGMISSAAMSSSIANIRLPQLSPAAATDIAVLLEELGMPELTARFKDEEVTPALLGFLDDSEMKKLGVTSMGARLKIKLAAQSLTSGRATAMQG